MKFRTDRPVKIVMLGAGGTGGHAAPHLYRLLCALDRNVRFILVDGDAVEDKNLCRQNFSKFDLGKNKARTMAERYADAFGIEPEYIPDFIEDKARLKALLEPEIHSLPRHVWYREKSRLAKAVNELVILIGAVDNNKSRRLCHDVFMDSRDLVYIDSGNGEFSGQVVCGVRRGGKTMFQPVGALYPDILEVTDKFPTELSCAEASISAPQTITANVAAATIVVELVYNIVVLGENDVRSASFSTKTINTKSYIKRPKRSAAK